MKLMDNGEAGVGDVQRQSRVAIGQVGRCVWWDSF
jgi:hypothetical protein